MARWCGSDISITPVFIGLWILALGLLPSCDKKDPTGKPTPAKSASGNAMAPIRPVGPPQGAIEAHPLSARPKSGPTLFASLPPDQTGVNFINPIKNDHPGAYLYTTGLAGGGVAIGDFDSDGMPDLLLASQVGQTRLYRQLAPWKFQDVTEQAGLNRPGWATGVTFVDINNDGKLDIYICHYASPNALYINQGGGRFVEAAKAWGLDFNGASHTAAFADYDRDGDLDLYLLTNRLYPIPGEDRAAPNIRMADGRPVVPETHKEQYYTIEKPRGQFDVVVAGQRDYLLKNNGDGTFTDATKAAGLNPDACFHGLSVSWWDMDGDGWLDLYIANDFYDPDHWYRNKGDGTFADVSRGSAPHTPWFSMGSDFADINNDGRLDYLASDMAATTNLRQKIMMGSLEVNEWFLYIANPRQYMRNALYLNTGTGRFQEAAWLTGLAATDWTWSVKFGDYDNDGRIDVYFTNGIVRNLMDTDEDRELAKQVAEIRKGRPVRELSKEDQKKLDLLSWDGVGKRPTRPEMNLAFANRGDLRFENVSKAWGLDHLAISFGAAWSDLDGDGDLDMVVNNVNEPASLYRNEGDQGHRIIVKLRGTRSNSMGIGARITVATAAGTQMRLLNPVRGYMSSNEPIEQFGLGELETIDELAVHWPSGAVQKFQNLKADQAYTITEPADPQAAKAAPDKPAPPPLFKPSESLPFIAHREFPVNGFGTQKLLPYALTELGPGLAWGDVDGDGDDDLFIGGAAGQPGMLYLNDGKGNFTRNLGQPFSKDEFSEDMGAVWFDADGDGDLDLYVASGGVESEPNHPVLRDRLYLNDGTGGLKKADSDALPDHRESTSAVAAVDFDGDGDLDLFVGSRLKLGQWPTAPPSRLLINEGGKFRDATVALAPALAAAGPVTGALWTDVDGDGRSDLLLSIEWGPIRLYRNTGGKLVEATAQAGLDRLTGWWMGIAGGDLDGDGDMDYVVSNLGLNSRYKASPEKPAVLYFGDIDGSGVRQVIEGIHEGDKIYPLRSKWLTTYAMPFLEQEFSTYRKFGAATLDELYTPAALGKSLKLTCNTLQTGLLINDGKGKFEFRPLPPMAQLSASFGAVVNDLDGDGLVDIYLAQNLFSMQPEFGRLDGSVSLLLRGDGKGGFAAVSPSQSGLVVPGDARSVTLSDLNGDGRPDLTIGVNNDLLVSYNGVGSSPNEGFWVRLTGPKSNPNGLGARVQFTPGKGDAPVAGAQGQAGIAGQVIRTSQVYEIYGGGGYLSQSSGMVHFSRGFGVNGGEVEVKWPDGKVSKAPIDIDLKRVVVKHPSLLP